MFDGPARRARLEDPMSAIAKKTLLIRNGTLIDGSGNPAARNDAIVVEGNRIKSIGALPPDVHPEDHRHVEVIDAPFSSIVVMAAAAAGDAPRRPMSTRCRAPCSTIQFATARPSEPRPPVMR